MWLFGKDDIFNQRRMWFALPVMTVLAGVMIIGQWLLDRWSLGVAYDAYFSLGNILANAAVSLCCFALFAALFRRLLLAWLLVATFTCLLYVASSVKYELLGMPLMLQDLSFLAGFDLSVLGLFFQYVQGSWQTMMAIAGFLASIAFLFWFEPRWCRTRSKLRITILGVSILLMVLLFMARWPWTTGPYDSESVRPSPLSSITATLRSGLVTSFVYYNAQIRDRHFSVDPVVLESTMAKVAYRDAAAMPLQVGQVSPDVIIVLSESFMDPRVMKGMEQVPDIIPNMRAALDSGRGGMMRVPTFGGGTVRTEFEILTGLPVRAFDGVHYPYVDFSMSKLPGVVGELKSRGYSSFALHGNTGAFWNRTTTYRTMGIDRFITLRSIMKSGGVFDGAWLSDASMTDALLSEVDATTEPFVAVAISIQAHGPYGRRDDLAYPDIHNAIELPAGLSEEASAELRSYLYHLGRADVELGRLVDAMDTRGKPYLLLFFGDHLPAFKAVYDELGFVDGREASDQLVPWMMAGNQALGGLPDYMESWEMPAWLMAAAGHEVPWFEFSRKVGEQLREPLSEAERNAMEAGLRSGASARITGDFERHIRK